MCSKYSDSIYFALFLSGLVHVCESLNTSSLQKHTEWVSVGVAPCAGLCSETLSELQLLWGRFQLLHSVPCRSSMVLSTSEDLTPGMEKAKTLRHFPPYGSINAAPAGDTCPTCHGTGRIPKG